MRRKLTIAMSGEVYRAMQARVGPREISRFIEDLVRPQVVAERSLEQEYLEAANDLSAERDTDEWIEANFDEALE
jgi:hypothetical protein